MIRYPLKRIGDRSTAPVLHWMHGWVLLTSDGRYSPAGGDGR